MFSFLLNRQRDDGDVDWPVTSQMPLTDTVPDAEQKTDADPYNNEYWTRVPLS